MPREQINYPDLEHKDRILLRRQMDGPTLSDDDPIPSEYEPWNESTLHVSWVADGDGPRVGSGHVQVGFEVDLNYIKFASDLPNGRTPDRTVMWTDTLTAGDIDRLILTLKKAKRKAFPSKE